MEVEMLTFNGATDLEKTKILGSKVDFLRKIHSTKERTSFCKKENRKSISIHRYQSGNDVIK